MPIHRIFVYSASLVFALSISVAFADGPNLGTAYRPRRRRGLGYQRYARRLRPAGRKRYAGARRADLRGKMRRPATTRTAKNKFGFSTTVSEAARSPTYRPGMKTIANFLALFHDASSTFIRRGMPWQQPKSLTDDEVYALTAFILAKKNKLIGETDTMNPETLPKVRMPNRGGFIIPFPPR